MRHDRGGYTLRALTAEGKQRETQVPGHLLPVVGKALRWGKSGVSTHCRPPASPPDHPPRPRIADCTLYIGLLSAKKTTMQASQKYNGQGRPGGEWEGMWKCFLHHERGSAICKYSFTVSAIDGDSFTCNSSGFPRANRAVPVPGFDDYHFLLRFASHCI